MKLSAFESLVPTRLRNFQCITLPLFLVLFYTSSASAQKKITCPDGDHYQIDLKQISIEYNGSSFAATLSGLSVLRGHVAVSSQTLQEAAAATQQWNEFLKGLVAGFNSCAISRKQYAEGLQHIYPALRSDAQILERIRELISEGLRVDEDRLEKSLSRFMKNMRRMAEIGGRGIIIERITAIVESGTEKILERLNELERKFGEVPLVRPAEVHEEISEIKAALLAKADEAESVYNKGYESLQRYRFAEAIPHLQRALKIVKLPAFYLALGTALLEEGDLLSAEDVLREGLKIINHERDRKCEAALSSELGRVLNVKGDLDGAVSYAGVALRLAEQVYGPSDRRLAPIVNNMGQMYHAKGDLTAALTYAERALKILNDTRNGSSDPDLAIVADNLGAVLYAKGDLNGALRYMQLALQIDESFCGADDPKIAAHVNNIAQVMKARGNLVTALSYAQRALRIDEKAYGTNHPKVAVLYNNFGQILWAKGDLDGAVGYTQRALGIYETAYGPNHPDVALCANNIGQILKSKGDLDGALRYTQRALEIDKTIYGAKHPTVAIRASNIGGILHEKGDLDGALRYTQLALEIDEATYGSNHPKVAKRFNNIGQILRDKGDLDGALRYTQRALQIVQATYGPDNPATRTVLENLRYLQELKNKTEK